MAGAGASLAVGTFVKVIADDRTGIIIELASRGWIHVKLRDCDEVSSIQSIIL